MPSCSNPNSRISLQISFSLLLNSYNREISKMGVEPVHFTATPRPSPSTPHRNHLLTHPVSLLAPTHSIFHTAGGPMFTIINQITSLPCLKFSSGSHFTKKKKSQLLTVAYSASPPSPTSSPTLVSTAFFLGLTHGGQVHSHLRPFAIDLS